MRIKNVNRFSKLEKTKSLNNILNSNLRLQTCMRQVRRKSSARKLAKSTSSEKLVDMTSVFCVKMPP